MTYETICRYVFTNEKVPWKLHDSKSRKRELIFARQVSMYLGKSIFKEQLSFTQYAALFGKDSHTAMHANKTIKNLMFSDPAIREKIFKYNSYINDHIKRRREVEIKSLLKMKNAEVLKSLLDVIDKMELVAKIYCEITDSKLIKQTVE